MTEIFEIIRISEFFYCNEEHGIGCRTDDYDVLTKHYPLSEFIEELTGVIDYVNRSENARDVPFFRALAYTYLFAGIYFYWGDLLKRDRYIRRYIENFEKAIRPTLITRLFGSGEPPEQAAKHYAIFKKAAPYFEPALPIFAFILARCGNYDLYRAAVRNSIDVLDEMLPKTGIQLSPSLFQLLEFMDRVPPRPA